MRTLTTCLAVMLPFTGAMAAGLTSAQIKEIDTYWQDADLVCGKAESKDKCYEERALKLHADIAKREGDILTLKLQNGTKEYNDVAPAAGFNKIYLLGYIKSLDAFIVRHWFAMDADVHLVVSRKTGEEISLYDSPSNLKFSADGTRALSYLYSEMQGSGLAVYSVNDVGELKQIYEDSGSFDYQNSEYKQNPDLGKQASCLLFEGKDSNGERLYLGAFDAHWLDNKSDEIVISAQYWGNSYYSNYTCKYMDGI